MRVVIQRVKSAEVKVQPDYQAKIDEGLLIFLGIENEDNQEDIDWLVRKISNMRLFADKNNRMNLSLLDTGFKAMVISQFTLHASTKKGNRPSFVKAGKPEMAEPIYNNFVEKLSESLSQKVKTGVFGGDMEVTLTNNGPVTIFMDSKDKY